MVHKHAELIHAWNLNTNIEFEFAYGVGCDFTWQDCDIKFVIDNPNVQIRIKQEPKQDERLIAAYDLFVTYCNSFGSSPCTFKTFSGKTLSNTKENWLAIVDKTNYRKGE